MKIKLRAYNVLAYSLLSAISLSGCTFLGVGSNKFACPGGVDGVHCMSARDVYKATESTDYVKAQNEIDKIDPEPNDNQENGEIKTIEKTITQVTIPRINQPIPIRTQAKVMRIWVMPWEDIEGDLHADGYLYTEIESRKWGLGDRFTAPNATISPLGIGISHPED